MKGKLKALMIFVGLVLVIATAGVGYNILRKSVRPQNLTAVQEDAANRPEPSSRNEQEEPPAEGESKEEAEHAAPNFHVYKADGEKVALHDLLGTPVILNFWASWCPPCKSEMPEFEKAFQALGTEISFMMVDMTDGRQETQETGAAYIADSGYTFPVYYDLDMDAAITYGVTSIPTTYFIDSEGRLAAVGNGMLDEEALYRGIEYLLP